MLYRVLTKDEYNVAINLSIKVFDKFESKNHTQDGRHEFYKSVSDTEYLKMLKIYGAFENDCLVGIIATRNNGKHIALFFVDEAYQKKGIGTQLFKLARLDNNIGEITVNSSVYATNIYHKLGFCDMSKETVTNGIRYTPMKYTDKILTTQKLILRPWKNSDAESLYKYAKDPAVGPIAGWPPHTSVENSLEIIRNVLSADETYAVCLKKDNVAIGSIGLMIGENSNLDICDNEGEIGYWIGVPFWGQGLIPQACHRMIKHAFDDLKLKRLWCGYFDGNIKSKRCQEKCGFIYHHTNKNIYWALMNDYRTEHVTCLERKNMWRDKNADTTIN